MSQRRRDMLRRLPPVEAFRPDLRSALSLACARDAEAGEVSRGWVSLRQAPRGGGADFHATQELGRERRCCCSPAEAAGQGRHRADRAAREWLRCGREIRSPLGMMYHCPAADCRTCVFLQMVDGNRRRVRRLRVGYLDEFTICIQSNGNSLPASRTSPRKFRREPSTACDRPLRPDGRRRERRSDRPCARLRSDGR